MMKSFAHELKNLLSKTNVKNSAIAEAVQYDSSYISKWLSGRMLPSERNIDKVVKQIAKCIVEGSSDMNITALCTEYGTDKAHLEGVIVNRLLESYRKETASTDAVTLQVYGTLLPVIKGLPWNGAVSISVDLFSIEHGSRLLLAGIHDGRFVGNRIMTESGTAYPVKILVNIDGIADKIYDPIFLVHMMNSYSNVNLDLYGCPFSVGKFIYVDEKMLLSGHLMDENHVLSLIRQEDAAAASQMTAALETFCTQESMLVKRMDDLLDGYIYMQFILSSGHDFITGHFTEQMIPENLFLKIASEVDPDSKLLVQIDAMLKDTVPRSRVLIYRSAFTKLIVNGELGFFNHRIMLSMEQKKECIEYVRHLAETGAVRIIDGGFSSDFQHISDPCVFLADSADYIRLENGRYENNLWNIVNRDLRRIYHEFFDEVWDNGGEVVVKEKTAVLNIIDLYRAGMNL